VGLHAFRLAFVSVGGNCAPTECACRIALVRRLGAAMAAAAPFGMDDARMAQRESSGRWVDPVAALWLCDSNRRSRGAARESAGSRICAIDGRSPRHTSLRRIGFISEATQQKNNRSTRSE